MSKSRNLLFSSPDYDGWRAGSRNIWEKLRGERLLVAFSGGKDSLALLHYVWMHKELMGWDILACHVNHNLRGEESYEDVRFCKNWCFEREILYIEVEVDLKNSSEVVSRGVEYAARAYRYRVLEEVRIKSDCGYILTAHSADDQLESFFVDLMTGASLFTLGGIESASGRLVRPVLGVSAENTAEYIERNALLPVYDSSNNDLRYVRNLVRQKLIPTVKELDSGIINSIRRIQAESSALKEWMEERTACAVSHMAEGGVIIDRKQLDSFSSAERRYVIGKWLSFLCRGGAVHAEAIIERFARRRSARHNLPEGWLCEMTPRSVRIFPAASVAPFCADKPVGVSTVELPGGREVLFPQYMAGNMYRVRSRKKGDRYNGKKLKDLFEKRGFDPYLRDRAIVVEDSRGIVWVEHLKNSSETTLKVVNLR